MSDNDCRASKQDVCLAKEASGSSEVVQGITASLSANTLHSSKWLKAGSSQNSSADLSLSPQRAPQSTALVCVWILHREKATAEQRPCFPWDEGLGAGYSWLHAGFNTKATIYRGTFSRYRAFSEYQTHRVLVCGTGLQGLARRQAQGLWFTETIGSKRRRQNFSLQCTYFPRAGESRPHCAVCSTLSSTPAHFQDPTQSQQSQTSIGK